MTGCEPDSAALPGLEHNDAAAVPGAHAAWLSTAAPPGLRTRLSTAGRSGPAHVGAQERRRSAFLLDIAGDAAAGQVAFVDAVLLAGLQVVPEEG